MYAGLFDAAPISPISSSARRDLVRRGVRRDHGRLAAAVHRLRPDRGSQRRRTTRRLARLRSSAPTVGGGRRHQLRRPIGCPRVLRAGRARPPRFGSRLQRPRRSRRGVRRGDARARAFRRGRRLRRHGRSAGPLSRRPAGLLEVGACGRAAPRRSIHATRQATPRRARRTLNWRRSTIRSARTSRCGRSASPSAPATSSGSRRPAGCRARSLTPVPRAFVGAFDLRRLAPVFGFRHPILAARSAPSLLLA